MNLTTGPRVNKTFTVWRLLNEQAMKDKPQRKTTNPAHASNKFVTALLYRAFREISQGARDKATNWETIGKIVAE